MPTINQASSFSGYASTTDWEDTDAVIACTVECNIDGVPHAAMFMCEDPLEAIKYAQKNFEKLTWTKIVPKVQ